MKVRMGKTGYPKVGVIQYAGMKFRVVDSGADKGRSADPANSKGAVLEHGIAEICVCRKAIDRHLIKIGLTEKVRWEAMFDRLIEQLLIDDFQRLASRAL